MLYTFKDLLQHANAPCRACKGSNKIYIPNGNASITPELILDTDISYEFEIEAKYRSKFTITIHPGTNFVSSNQIHRITSFASHLAIACLSCEMKVETFDMSFKETNGGWILNPLSIHYEHIPLQIPTGHYIIDNFVCGDRCSYKKWTKTEYGVVRYDETIEFPCNLDPFLSKDALIQKIELLDLLG